MAGLWWPTIHNNELFTSHVSSKNNPPCSEVHLYCKDIFKNITPCYDRDWNVLTLSYFICQHPGILWRYLGCQTYHNMRGKILQGERVECFFFIKDSSRPPVTLSLCQSWWFARAVTKKKKKRMVIRQSVNSTSLSPVMLLSLTLLPSTSLALTQITLVEKKELTRMQRVEKEHSL